MKIKYTIILCTCFSYLFGQQYAGSEKTVCSAFTSVTLGIPHPNPDHCYEWLQLESSDGKFSSNPIVHPKETTTYNVKVTDHDFSFIAYDKVKVKVEIGRIAVLGEPIIPTNEESESQALAQLLDSEISNVNWSISEDQDNTGCEIENSGQYGDISNCISPGMIKIRATDASNINCYAEKDVIVGSGIIELAATDAGNPGRTAYHGKTLYVVGPSTVRFQALPLAGYTLPPDQPEWGGTILPDEEHTLEWESDELDEGTYLVTCSDFSITVVVLDDEEEEFEIPTDFSNWIGYKDAVGSISYLPSDCGEPPHVTININNQINGTAQNMEKDNSPNYYIKVHAQSDNNNGGYLVKADGCGELVEYSKNYSIPGFGQFELVPVIIVDGSPGNKINNQILLENSATSEDLEEIALSFSGEIRLLTIPTINGNQIDVFATPAFQEISSTLSGEFRLDDKKIEYQVKWGGLQMNPRGYLYTGTPSNPIWKTPANLSVNILDGHQTGWKLFADLSQLFD